MDAKAVERLRSVYRLTESPVEHEANAALAMTKKLLAQHGKRMSDLPEILTSETQTEHHEDAARPAQQRSAADRAARDPFEDAMRAAAAARSAERAESEARARQGEREREAARKRRAEHTARELDQVRAMARADGHQATSNWPPKRLKDYARSKLIAAIMARCPEECPDEPTNPYLELVQMEALKRVGCVALWMETENARLDMRRPIDVCVTKRGYGECLTALKPADILAGISSRATPLEALRTLAAERLSSEDHVNLWLNSTNPLLSMRRPIDVCIDLNHTLRLCAEVLNTTAFRGRQSKAKRRA